MGCSKQKKVLKKINVYLAEITVGIVKARIDHFKVLSLNTYCRLIKVIVLVTRIMSVTISSSLVYHVPGSNKHSQYVKK